MAYGIKPENTTYEKSDVRLVKTGKEHIANGLWRIDSEEQRMAYGLWHMERTMNLTNAAEGYIFTFVFSEPFQPIPEPSHPGFSTRI